MIARQRSNPLPRCSMRGEDRRAITKREHCPVPEYERTPASMPMRANLVGTVCERAWSRRWRGKARGIEKIEDAMALG